MINKIPVIRGYIYIIYCRIFCKRIHIENGLILRSKLKIIGPGYVNIGKNCVIDSLKGDKCKYVTIDTHANDAEINIGNNVGIFSSRISSKYQVNIGNNVLIEDVGILDTDFHSIDKDRGDPQGESFEKCRINIGNNVCIGSNSLVTKGVNIGTNVLAMPGSIITTNIKENSIVCGNPARPIVQSKEMNQGGV